MRGLEGKVAIVTGGGGGIGSAIAARLASHGATIGVFDKNQNTARDVVRTIRDAGGTAHAVPLDITEYNELVQKVASFEELAGPTDILVNNVGWDRLSKFLDTTPDFWDQLIAVNLTSALNMSHIVARGMVERSSGKVVNIASDAGRIGNSGEAVYSATKGGLIAFTKSLARELARYNISVNAVCPGPTETPLLQSFLDQGEWGKKAFSAIERTIPMRRVGTPADIDGIVAFLASSDADYITGQVISVSGGLTMHG